MNGAYGGFPPFPSGDGTLAFVEFTRIGNGESPIVVNGTAQSPVPEPASVALLTIGLLATRVRQASGARSGESNDHSSTDS